ncbi:MAG: Tab2/Atab2 family RNA-binding protein [Xenococcaceae cyanobacterium MO_188.B29]|nr:Tab2/Atab2 family RNA-binding protein [Xenococcaceae cyanobacterium MO_188.B29]
MKIWQIDFYYFPWLNTKEQKQWKLLICDRDGSLVYEAECLQAQANADWLIEQIQQAAKKKLPDKIQVFRPQALGLLSMAAEKLGIDIESTRRTSALKEELNKQARQYGQQLPNYNPLALDKPPPQPLPEDLWGEQWNFASIAAGELEETFGDRPIPVIDLPESLLPLNLGISSAITVPGIVIYGGRKSLQIVRWLQQQQPVALNYIPTEVGKSGGLVLEVGLVDRWVFATFEDEAVAKAARNYEQSKQQSQGLHFLLVQPDDSGMTYTGFWLLRDE